MTGSHLAVAFAVLLASGAASANSLGAHDELKSNCVANQGDFPSDRSLHYKLAKTLDERTLVNVTSYLILLDPAQSAGYLPLELQEILRNADNQSPAGDDMIHTLSLLFDCARIDLKLTQREREWSLSKIQASLIGGDKALACSSQPMDNVFPLYKRYSCLGRLVFSCYTEGKDEAGASYAKPLAEIVFANGLDIELFGDPYIIKDDKFSQEPYVSSCPK